MNVRSQQGLLSALNVSLKAVVLRNAVAQLRIYDVGALLVRKTVGGLSAVQIQNIDFNRPFHIGAKSALLRCFLVSKDFLHL